MTIRRNKKQIEWLRGGQLLCKADISTKLFGLPLYPVLWIHNYQPFTKLRFMWLFRNKTNRIITITIGIFLINSTFITNQYNINIIRLFRQNIAWILQPILWIIRNRNSKAFQHHKYFNYCVNCSICEDILIDLKCQLWEAVFLNIWRVIKRQQKQTDSLCSKSNRSRYKY